MERKAKEAGNIHSNSRTGSRVDNPDTNKQAESNKKRKGAETVADNVIHVEPHIDRFMSSSKRHNKQELLNLSHVVSNISALFTD